MLSIISLILGIVCVIGVGFLIVLVLKKKQPTENADQISVILKDKLDHQKELFSSINEMVLASLKNYNENVLDQISKIAQLESQQFSSLEKRLDNILRSTEERMNRAILEIQNGLKNIENKNETKLEQMRQTVDEKLSSSLEKRLTESFNVINNRLQSVYEGLGEMKQLATGVGDLKKVLTNVKTRGVFGEVQLGNLLSNMLAANQFKSNVQIKQGSQERVDFAILLPAKDGEVFLPIDAKFPIEDYQRMVDSNDNDVIETALKGIERRIKDEAKKIHDKYIDVPKTTDFAIMYLALEGLYGEVLRRNGLVEQIQREYGIIICGPTTCSAILSSLQLGFKTLAIEKRSSEIWKLLNVFKKEFVTFSGLLEKTQKKLEEATSSIEDASKKTKTIERKLRDVALIGDEESENIDAG